MAVDVYWNTRRGCYSVRAGGRVIEHTDQVVLRDVRFVVSAAGRARVLREQRKNVHAVVRGTRVAGRVVGPPACRVTYNPYKHATFVATNSGAAVYGAAYARCWVDPDGNPVVVCLSPRYEEDL